MGDATKGLTLSEFQKGDRVRITADHPPHSLDTHDSKGATGTVSKVMGSVPGSVRVFVDEDERDGSHDYYYLPDHLEHVQNENVVKVTQTVTTTNEDEVDVTNGKERREFLSLLQGREVRVNTGQRNYRGEIVGHALYDGTDFLILTMPALNLNGRPNQVVAVDEVKEVEVL